ncbi:hypothetical protein BCEN4_940031 [Burkholderia cenocepacia]|nr:hypothetical protein BCEN4_940031 [Burkholderia cenocepacia]
MRTCAHGRSRERRSGQGSERNDAVGRLRGGVRIDSLLRHVGRSGAIDCGRRLRVGQVVDIDGPGRFAGVEVASRCITSLCEG